MIGYTRRVFSPGDWLLIGLAVVVTVGAAVLQVLVREAR